jgi:tripartite-type tricarboxylate transporter receptor subunit TctC
MIHAFAAVALALSLVWSTGAPAQEWPTKPARMIVAAAPGGNPDILGRLLAQKLSNAFGKPFLVENVPGAGGVVAAKFVAGAPPDGHVLMLGDSGAMAINVALTPDLPYQPLRDFTPVTALVTVPTVLVIHPTLPANTVAEFIALAKAKPGSISYGSAGQGSVHHLTMAVFASRAGIEVLHAPYRGGTALVGGLMKGEVQSGWSGIPNVKPLIENGALKVLCISTAQRSKSLPAVAPCAESGFPGFDIATMIGLQLPAGAPAGIVARLQAEVAKALREPDMAERFTSLGMELQENGTAHYTRFLRDDIDRYTAAVKDGGIRAN